MKKIVSLFIAFLTVFSLAACSAEADSSDKLRVVTTVFPQYDFARAVCADTRDSVELTMLLPPGSESHDYEPSLADLKLIESCDLFICVGGETDEWVESAIASVGGDVNVLRLTDLVPLLPEDEDGIIEHDHHHHEDEKCHEDHASFDEHVWTSPENAALLTEAIAEAMANIRPKLRDSFENRAAEYAAKLRDLDLRFSALAENKEDSPLVFADRFPFRYFAHRYGFAHLAAFSGCSSDSEPTLATIYSLTGNAKDLGVHALFVTEFASRTTADVIAAQCEGTVYRLHSCHNVSREDFESGVTYLELMEQNCATLSEALQ